MRRLAFGDIYREGVSLYKQPRINNKILVDK